MTIQVGMVGLDGILLAGDTRISRTPSLGISASRIGYDGPKIRVGVDGKVAVTCSHDMQTANRVADCLLSSLSSGGHPTCEQDIKDVCVPATQGRSFECIIAFSAPSPSLYLFQQYVNDEHIFVQSQRILSCVPTGDMQNPATFWGMSYYSLLPLQQLRRLAACMVVAAGKLNTSMINGLELVICDSRGCRRLPESEALALRTDAENTIRHIGELILDVRNEHPSDVPS